MNWISIKDRLPENYSFILASIETREEKWVEIVGFANGMFQLPSRGEIKVLYWMPKPEPK